MDSEASYNCKAPPPDLATCSTDADCTTVAVGCHCGAQPVNGVARMYATAAQSCETAASNTCALGCPTEPRRVAQDGKKADIDATIPVRCDSSIATCKTYLP